jgi:hypothetical protein
MSCGGYTICCSNGWDPNGWDAVDADEDTMAAEDLWEPDISGTKLIGSLILPQLRSA